MAVPGHSPTYDDEEPFDMRALLRLSLWGIAAAVAVGLVVAAGSSERGAQRVMLAWGTLKAPLDGTHAMPPAQIARSIETDGETRRLAQQVRLLSADRERLAARLEAVERSVEDVTGSVTRQPQPSSPRAPADLPLTTPAEPAVAAKPQPSAPSSQASQPVEGPTATSHVATGHAPEIGWAASVGQPPAGSDAPDWPVVRPANDGLTAASVAPAAAPPTVTRTEFGVDIGGGATVSAMRGLWLSVRTSHPTLLEGLRPVVTIRDNPRGSTELRLIAGPLTNAAAAARLCGALSAAGLVCQPAVFDGQRLALR